MKIFVLTPIYATSTSMQGATPVVHYFTREWVKMGHDVTVFNFVAKYPKLFYWLGKHFQHKLNSMLGMLVPVKCPHDDDYLAEGVTVHRRCFKKIKPHSLYSKKELEKELLCVVNECEKSGIPDWFVGHWDNPQLELLDLLKNRFHKPTCLVVHDNSFDFEGKYGENGFRMLSNLDVLGFRSPVGLRRYEQKYGEIKRSFIASSGVSDAFLKAGIGYEKEFNTPVRNYVFVGSLINRKFPSLIVRALSRVYSDGGFTMTFIGDGAERENILKEHQRSGGVGTVRFTGRIPRDEIIEYLKQADVFVMISKGEIFGLVYLEAMALGLIPIGSKNEGIDGVITDEENGFLCTAGDVEELETIIEKIKRMSPESLKKMSDNAKKTANDYSDENVAREYINTLLG